METGERFLVDHMLVKLGAYLRCLGFDAIHDGTLRTHELILRANREQRIFVTCNRHLPLGALRPRRGVWLYANEPTQQLRELVELLRLDGSAHLFTRCVRCNAELRAIDSEPALLERVPQRVRARYHEFFACPRCDTVFWRGAHVRNTCRKLGLPDASHPLGRVDPW